MGFLYALQALLFAGLAFLFVVFAILYIVQMKITTPLPMIKRHKEEKSYLDPNNIKTCLFPSIEDEPTLDLSVIIPAYEEEQRLPKMLDDCMRFLEDKSKNEQFTYEVIVVSDGSRDGTVAVALKYSMKYTIEKFRVLELVENRGKGGAVRLGMLSTRGRKLLFADADGATKFSDYAKLEQSLARLTTDWKDNAIALGSRAHLEQESIATRSFFRTFLMHGFHFLVWLFCVRNISDTQCGFKLFTRAAARSLFNSLHVERWAFDVELLYLASRMKIPMAEVAVNWTEIEGSKLTPFLSSLQMGRDLFLIWFRYLIGAWQYKTTKQN